MCTDPGCRNPRCVELRHFWANYQTLIVESNTNKESPMKAVLHIGPAPTIIKTAQSIDPGTVFVTKGGLTMLRVHNGVMPLEGNINSFATYGLNDFFGNLRARDIEVSRVVGPLEISRA